jgi:hypothetical protein
MQVNAFNPCPGFPCPGRQLLGQDGAVAFFSRTALQNQDVFGHACFPSSMKSSLHTMQE